MKVVNKRKLTIRNGRIYFLCSSNITCAWDKYTPYQDPQHANNNIATSPKYSSKKETHRDVPMAQ